MIFAIVKECGALSRRFAPDMSSGLGFPKVTGGGWSNAMKKTETDISKQKKTMNKKEFTDEQNEKDLAKEVGLVISEIDNKRLAVTSEGHELKRSPYGTLQEKGMMKADFLMREFEKIENKQSSLSSGERKIISEIVMTAFVRLMAKRESKNKKQNGK